MTESIKQNKIAIILPCYNEEEVLPLTYRKLQKIIVELSKEDAQTNLVFVDDGSRDKTWQLIEQMCKEDAHVSGIKLSRNVGHQRCVWAGLSETVEKFDAMITIDADLQDDENTIIDMVRQFKEGCDVVYGVRKQRTTDSFFKRWSAQAFYLLMKKADNDIIYNHADYRLMSKRAVKALLQYPERNLFLRGMVRKVGFKEGFVYYDRKEREAGTTKYPLSKMIRLSFDGITSFSVAPLQFITIIGLIMMVVSVLAIVWAVYEYIKDHTIQGWTSILVSLWFIGGVVTTALGVIGTYIGKIYSEVKRRPLYFVDRSLNL
ncbi:MAG: glycosyltransferase family 2 protein [Prevotella sp.]|nr:glycosyltransferase family 2 protein [Prevotella sp.]MBQ6031553.1 glycosyltransferase family 2 protein [Prevotella sp.]MBQ6308662.1 glycosyltransferase family 2 protein [Prevotella sp.]